MNTQDIQPAITDATGASEARGHAARLADQAATPAVSTWNWTHTVTLGVVIAGIGLIAGRPAGAHASSDGRGTEPRN